tara:strand:- start:206 stop:439 length:234 start_codon:yes stop_codon:yes gene_type:complete
MQKQTKIPKSCEDMLIYNNGATCSNPYTGEKAELNNIELSLYDLIKGAEALGQWRLVQDGVDWFKRNNTKAYMVLLD